MLVPAEPPDAAPDHAATVYEYVHGVTGDREAARLAALDALDALLAERQQDKERIERLETAIRWMMALPKDSPRDMKATGCAALAVEEDAPE